MDYAFEHAAPTMFGDLTSESTAPFRLTVGGATESRFWALRTSVRAAALAAGTAVSPAAGLILKTLRIPWYYPTAAEPALTAMADPAAAIKALDNAANPKYGGNAGLNREARVLHKFVNDANAAALADAVHGDHLNSIIDGADVQVGKELQRQIGENGNV
jgi:hypothetical protein